MMLLNYYATNVTMLQVIKMHAAWLVLDVVKYEMHGKYGNRNVQPYDCSLYAVHTQCWLRSKFVLDFFGIHNLLWILG